MADFPEPTWPARGQPVDTEPCNSNCFRRDPYTLTGYFLQFTRAHFADPKNIINEDLKGYIWTDDDTTSRILIEPSFRHKVTNTQQRPAILFKRDAVEPMYPGFGDGQHLSHLEGPGPLEGKHVGIDFTVFIKGGHTIQCIGQSGAEAESLAMEVWLRYAGLKLVVKKDANLGKFIPTTISPVQKLDENQENWVVGINLHWAYTFDWTLVQEAPILKKIGISSVVN